MTVATRPSFSSLHKNWRDADARTSHEYRATPTRLWPLATRLTPRVPPPAGAHSRAGVWLPPSGRPSTSAVAPPPRARPSPLPPGPGRSINCSLYVPCTPLPPSLLPHSSKLSPRLITVVTTDSYSADPARAIAAWHRLGATDGRAGSISSLRAEA